MTPAISAIVAVGKYNRAICHDQDLLWVIPDDHKRMRQITDGHVLVMGRKTYESIGHPLRGRANIILTRQKDYRALVPHEYENETIIVVNSTDDAMAAAVQEELKRRPSDPEIFIFGGGEVYRETFERVTKLYLTIVDDPEKEKRGTDFFPDYSHAFTKVVEERKHLDNDPPFEYLTLERDPSSTS